MLKTYYDIVANSIGETLKSVNSEQLSVNWRMAGYKHTNAYAKLSLLTND